MNKREISLEHRLAVCQQIARLANANLPISGTLKQALAKSSKPAQELGAKIDQDVESGKAWSAALLEDPSPETHILAACIEAGELSERLGDSLQSWAGMHIANANARSSFRSALLYPTLLILVTVYF